MKLDLLSALNAERAARRAAVMITEMEGGLQRLVGELEIENDALAGLLVQQLRTGKSALVEEASRQYFLEVHLPEMLMVIAGAVHISQILAPVARMLGYRVTIVDPRTAFATPERFPGISLLSGWPDQALQKIQLDRWTAFVALTHDPKIDDPAVVAALKAGCFYIGALGSRKTHAKRIERLAALGISAEKIAHIHAPVGLSIGAETPGEIAVSILAEITLRRRCGPKANFAAIVLAAGRGTRMRNEDKLLAEVDGKSILRHTVEIALASHAREVIVVTGHKPERVVEALRGLDVKIVHNSQYMEGLSTSLRAGISALPSEIGAVAVLLADMPGISPNLINRLALAINPAAGALISVPIRDGKRGNPVVWSRRFFDELTKLKGDVGARPLISVHEEAVVEIAADDDGIFFDIDDPDALAAARRNGLSMS